MIDERLIDRAFDIMSSMEALFVILAKWIIDGSIVDLVLVRQ